MGLERVSRPRGGVAELVGVSTFLEPLASICSLSARRSSCRTVTPPERFGGLSRPALGQLLAPISDV
jgi:hypothetical protein